MATITIRNLDENVKRHLQVRAALHGRSMEAEARELLTESAQRPLDLSAVQDDLPEFGLGTAIHNLFAPLGGADDIQIPPRASAARRKGLGTAIHERFAKIGGVELEIPERTFSSRPLPTFQE